MGVGGGSVADAAKFIACATLCEKDPRQFFTGAEEPQNALPIGIVITAPATGSESNGNVVISRAETNEKRMYKSPFAFPTFAILDPTTTYSLSICQIRNSIVDAFIHVIEQYMVDYMKAPLQDRLCEGLLTTLIDFAPRNLTQTPTYDDRATLM